MATTFHKLIGTLEYPKLFEGQEDMAFGADEYGGDYKTNIWFDKETADKFKATGTATKGMSSAVAMATREEKGHALPPFDTKGMVMFKLRRKKEARRRDGTLMPELGGAPKVFRADGTLWNIQVDGYLNSGAKVEVDLEVYDAKDTKGTRPRSFRIIENGVKVEKPQAEPTGTQAPQVTTQNSDFDDELPF